MTVNNPCLSEYPMKNDVFLDYVRNADGAKCTDRGVYVRFDSPSFDQQMDLVAMALECSPDVLLCGPEEPDEPIVRLLCESVSPFVWRLRARRSDASAILQWGYMGNWCLFVGADAGKTHIPFEFRNLESVFDALFESVAADGGIVAFHDNATIWAYSRRATPENVSSAP